MSSNAWSVAQLENLEGVGALVRELTSPAEIERLLALADASLSGARTTSVAAAPARSPNIMGRCEAARNWLQGRGSSSSLAHCPLSWLGCP